MVGGDCAVTRPSEDSAKQRVLLTTCGRRRTLSVRVPSMSCTSTETTWHGRLDSERLNEMMSFWSALSSSSSVVSYGHRTRADGKMIIEPRALSTAIGEAHESSVEIRAEFGEEEH